ncbi:MAG: hypothetical protein JWO26_2515 [Rhodospirillales bacterium]|nr:hypothetical protein [Rhodospirillales bacterium]MDB5382883.1 hypothetical protein [Rhodospirillales bacterium]
MRGLATLLLLVGCAGGPPVCDGAVPMTQLTAYLGGSLSERDWQDFLVTSVTPAFPMASRPPRPVGNGVIPKGASSARQAER